MADVQATESADRVPLAYAGHAESSSFSIREVIVSLRRRRKIFFGVVGGCMLLCGLYCVIAPNQYEASATVALRMQPASSLMVGAAEAITPASILSTPLQLETLANQLRSERLAWRVITEMKLYEAVGFTRGFAARFPGFDALKPSPAAQGYLLDAFAKRLHVRTLPRTLLVEIRFRSRDPALAARVVNALIRTFTADESEGRLGATQVASDWLRGQLRAMTQGVQEKEKRLAEFERRHGFMTTQQTVPGGQPVETLHDSAVEEVDEAQRMWAEASGDRIFREALYREAQSGNPEQVLAANPGLRTEMGPGGSMQIQQLRTRLSDVGVELAQLKAEHGQNFPRVVELERAAADIEGQIKVQDASLIEAFERTWKAAAGREEMLRKQLDRGRPRVCERTTRRFNTPCCMRRCFPGGSFVRGWNSGLMRPDWQRVFMLRASRWWMMRGSRSSR